MWQLLTGKYLVLSSILVGLLYLLLLVNEGIEAYNRLKDVVGGLLPVT